MRLILLSPPGAGKGTLAGALSAHAGIGHFSSGDVLRAEIARGSDLGRRVAEYTSRGDLVPDDLLYELLTPPFVAMARSTGGYLLDGWPRTMAQALRSAELGVELGLSSDAVIYLRAPDEVIAERLLNRAALEGRADDNPTVIAHRIRVFHEQTAPLVDFYRSHGVLVEIDATPSPERVLSTVLAVLVERGVPLAR